jgi:signal transduction histidine kinase
VNSAAQALERLKALARLLLAASVGLAFMLAPPRTQHLYLLVALVLVVYFLYAALALPFHQQLTSAQWQVAGLVGDLAVLAVVLLAAPGHSGAFILFFVYFALLAGLWKGWWAAAGLSLLVSAAYLALAWRDSLTTLRPAWLGTFSEENWIVIGGLVAAGALVGTLAQRERRHLERAVEVERFGQLLSFDTRWEELWDRWLKELSHRFKARRALLAYHNPETDRVSLWQFRSDRERAAADETDRPPRDARTFLLDATPLGIMGNGFARPSGADWHLRHEFSPATTVRQAFNLPGRFALEFSPRSLLSVPLSIGSGGRARVFLLDSQRGEFTLGEFTELQWLMAGLAPMLANLLTVRGLIAQAVNQERDEISRSLHDGVAQTLASLEMQLKVYQGMAGSDPQRTAVELARLQGVVKQEQEALRRFVRTLKPVRVPAGELGQWMLAHCAQFQQETGIEVDVQAQPVDATLPEGVCREVFLILREALHNVRKHAGARHVTVRLQQDDSHLQLLIRDDGNGFSFSGSYTQEALDAKGLLPVSIGEHARAVEGVLTIESLPGSGATVRVDVPLD